MSHTNKIHGDDKISTCLEIFVSRERIEQIKQQTAPCQIQSDSGIRFSEVKRSLKAADDRERGRLNFSQFNFLPRGVLERFVCRLASINFKLDN